MNAVKCSKCKMDIPADAKICPFCKSKRTTAFQVYLFIFFAIAVVVAAMNIEHIISFAANEVLKSLSLK